MVALLLIIAADDPMRFPTGTLAPAGLTTAPDIHHLSPKRTETTVWTQKDAVYQGQRVGQVVAEVNVGHCVAQRRDALWSLSLSNTLMTILLVGARYLLIRRMMRQVRVLSQVIGSHARAGLEEIPASAFASKNNEFAALFARYYSLVRAEKERRDIARRLADEARLVSLGRLSATLAHEINNPLTGLLNAVDTLRTFQHQSDVVEASAEILHRGLNNLRDVSRATLEVGRPAGQDKALSAAASGAGVGLTSVHDITQNLGGGIKVVASGERGSKITIRLPPQSNGRSAT
jgi:signal transduction histidine kinase